MRFDVDEDVAEFREALEQFILHAMADAVPHFHAQVRVDFGEFSLRRYRDAVYLVRHALPPTGWHARWEGQTELPLPPGLGCVRFVPATGQGLSLARLSRHLSQLRFRRGGERLSPGPGRPHRLLRDMFQEAAVPPWLRDQVPMLVVDDQLAWVAGLGEAAEFQARDDEPAVRLEWIRGEQAA